MEHISILHGDKVIVQSNRNILFATTDVIFSQEIKIIFISPTFQGQAKWTI
jgi:hypothetical protein